jgi:di/tricarboxylate transporter
MSTWSAAEWSLVALLIVIVVSFVSRVNVGVLAIALAWPIAVVVARWKVDALLATFPSSLFLTLVGVGVLFALAQANGTIGAIAQLTVRRVARSRAALPPLLFIASAALSTAGAGAISTTALMAPLAMGLARHARVPSVLTALMVGNGANAGNLSPITSVGIIVRDGMAKAALHGHEWRVWLVNVVAHTAAGLTAWWLFGGLALLRERADTVTWSTPAAVTSTQWRTVLVLVLWMAAVLALGAPPGVSAFAAAALLLLLEQADDRGWVALVPWGVFLMVGGVSMLIALLEKTGGMTLFSTALAHLATPSTVNGVIAAVTGVLSSYSSTSGVVYPTFLPAIPGLVERLGGGDPLQIALSINVGAALVDVSPLSTIGALCLAAMPRDEGVDTRRAFRQLLAWGLSMAIAGALFCQLVVPWFV